MVSVVSKKRVMFQNLDRVSELPEPIILDLLSRLPLEDSARASVLSKTWKSFCSLYPILHFDHHLFALQSAEEPDSNKLRDMFMDDVDHHLSRAILLTCPIRKITLTVSIDDSTYYSRVDTWLELVRQMHVEHLSIFVQTRQCVMDLFTHFFGRCYVFPISMLSSKGLHSLYVRGCKLGSTTLDCDPTFMKEVPFFGLKELRLTQVSVKENVFMNLVRCCQGIEMLVLDACVIEMEYMELSMFPKLRTALVAYEDGYLDNLDISNTNLQCFKCQAPTEFHLNPAAGAGIRELTLMDCNINQPNLFKDLTATFPLLEEVELYIPDTDTLKAINTVLRKLNFFSSGSGCVKEVYIDCPSLIILDFRAEGVTELYVDCPKLRQFEYYGTTIPDQVFFRSTADLVESSCGITMKDAANTLWFINLRAFLKSIWGSKTNVSLFFNMPMATFLHEEVEAVQTSPLYSIHLYFRVAMDVQNIDALVDATLWTIRPCTFTIHGTSYYLVKYLCENLMKKSQVDICDQQLTSHPCWMDHLEDFQVESPLEIVDTKENLAALPKHCWTPSDKICFTFHWSYK